MGASRYKYQVANMFPSVSVTKHRFPGEVVSEFILTKLQCKEKGGDLFQRSIGHGQDEVGNSTAGETNELNALAGCFTEEPWCHDQGRDHQEAGEEYV